MPLRQLRSMGRAESTLLQARDASAADQLKWVVIAAMMVFFEQAHLSREFRRITCLSPSALKDLLTQEHKPTATFCGALPYDPEIPGLLAFISSLYGRVPHDTWRIHPH